MEAKLAQQLAFIERPSLYVIFIDLHKAYDAMHRGRCIEILWAAGVGEKALRLITRFWKYSVMACRAGGRYGRRFKARRGMTQGGPLSPTICNLMVDAVVREWLSRALSPEEAREAILQVRQLMAAFYADDAVVASRDPVKLQDSFNELTALFDRVGLKTNAKKTEVMVMTPGRIRAKLSPEGYEARMRLDGEDVGRGGRGPGGRTVQCPKCCKTLKAASLRSHMETQPDEFEVFVPPAEDAASAPPATYRVRRDAARGGYGCPVEGCPYPRARDHYRLRAHFRFRHQKDAVVIDRTTFPRCEACGM